MHADYSKLSAVSYDPLTHSRHNATDRNVKVGHEISIAETVGADGSLVYPLSGHVAG